MVGYRNYSGDNDSRCKIGTISATDVISYGDGYVFDETDVNYTSISTLDSTHFVIGYRDSGSPYYGRTVIGTYSLAAGPANVKSWNGVALADIKSINGISISSIKSVNGLE